MDNLKNKKLCWECGRIFQKQEEFVTHVKSHFVISKKVKKNTHKKNKLSSNVKRCIRCTICGKTYSSIASLKTHTYIYHKEKNNKVQVIQAKNLDISDKVDETSELKNNLLKCTMCNVIIVNNVIITTTVYECRNDNLLPSFGNKTKRILCMTCQLRLISNLNVKEEKYIGVPIKSELVSGQYCSKYHSSVLESLSSPRKLHCILCNTTCERVDHKDINTWFFPTTPELIQHPHDHVLEQLTLTPRKFYCIFCETICDNVDHLEINQWIKPT